MLRKKPKNNQNTVTILGDVKFIDEYYELEKIFADKYIIYMKPYFLDIQKTTKFNIDNEEYEINDGVRKSINVSDIVYVINLDGLTKRLENEIKYAHYQKKKIMYYYIPTVSAIIMNDKGEILLERHVRANGLALPGGKIDYGENEFNALKRELYEELNIKIEHANLVSHNTVKNVPYKLDWGIMNAHFYDTFYVIKLYNGEIINKEPNKHKELLWLSPTELEDRDDLTFFLSEIIKMNVFKQAIEIAEGGIINE